MSISCTCTSKQSHSFNYQAAPINTEKKAMSIPFRDPSVRTLRRARSVSLSLGYKPYFIIFMLRWRREERREKELAVG
jgi:hypothetical protein